MKDFKDRRRNRGVDPMGGARLAVALALFVITLLIVNRMFPTPDCTKASGTARTLCEEGK